MFVIAPVALLEHVDAVGTDGPADAGMAIRAVSEIAVVREHCEALRTEAGNAPDRLSHLPARGGGIGPQLNREQVDDVREKVDARLHAVIHAIEIQSII